MDTKLMAILLRFPERRDIIMKRIEENEDFRDLCSDYGLCIEMIMTLEKETELQQAKLDEYLELKLDMEEEVLKYLH